MLADSFTETLKSAEMMMMIVGFIVAMMGLGLCFRFYPRNADPKSVLASRIVGTILFIGGIAFAIWLKVTSLTL